MSLLSLIPGVGTLFDPILGIINKFIPDATERQKAQEELIATAQSNDFQLALQQLKIDDTEAASKSLFVSGWRPAIGWVGAIALMYSFVIQPFAVFGLSAFGVKLGTQLPALDVSSIMALVLAMLGLGGMRTYEKVNGVNSGH